MWIFLLSDAAMGASVLGVPPPSSSAGLAIGTSIVAGVGAAISTGVGAVVATSTVAGSGASTISGVGAAYGTSIVAGFPPFVAPTPDLYLPFEFTSTEIEVGNENPFGIDPEQTTIVVNRASSAITAGFVVSTSEVSGTGLALFAAAGSAVGTSAVGGVGTSIGSGIGAAFGSSRVTGFATSSAGGAGSSLGTTSVNGTSAATSGGSGSAFGTSTVAGTGIGTTAESGAGYAVGTSTVAAVGASIASGVGLVYPTPIRTLESNAYARIFEDGTERLLESLAIRTLESTIFYARLLEDGTERLIEQPFTAIVAGVGSAIHSAVGSAFGQSEVAASSSAWTQNQSFSLLGLI